MELASKLDIFDSKGKVSDVYKVLKYDKEIVYSKERKFSIFYTYEVDVRNEIDLSIYLIHKDNKIQIIYNASIEVFEFTVYTKLGYDKFTVSKELIVHEDYWKLNTYLNDYVKVITNKQLIKN